MSTILILGDSSSMTFGLEQHTYPSYLAQQKIWTDNTEIINGSQPGFTSAGICAFYFQYLTKFPKLSAVIIYIGNNDGVTAEIKQGKYTRMKNYYFQIRTLLNLPKLKNKYNNILTPYEWNNNTDLSIEHPENPSDFKYNIERIIKSCFKRHTHIYLIKPQANYIFPAGLGKGNFIFYRYISLKDELSEKLKVNDNRFLMALGLQESGEHEKAQKIYQEILEQQKNDGQNLEFFLMIVNNYAVAAAQIGNLEEAEVLLETIKKDIYSRNEIYLFNLAQIFKLKKKYDKYEKYLKLAYEADRTVYRIKKPYLYVIDDLSEKYKNHLTVIDLHKFCNKEDFVDYCHLLPDAHLKLANHLSLNFKKIISNGDQRTVIQNVLTNPELALGNKSDFFEYLEVFAPFSKDEIKRIISQFKTKLFKANNNNKSRRILDNLPGEFINAFNYYLSTPYFSTFEEILRFGPKYSFDIGRLPEFFLYRYVLQYLKILENNKSLASDFSVKHKLLRSSKEIISLLPVKAVKVINKELSNEIYFDAKLDKLRIESILLKIKNQLLNHLKKSNQIHERIKTTIYWYFRESLRFGFHSRISMRYDRLFLEYCTDALAIAVVLDSKLGNKKKVIIKQIINWLEETDEIHQKYCIKFSLDGNNSKLMTEYDLKLFRLALKIKNFSF